ncbi:MAG: TonB-dependent receptor plug domain-containing protein, partial [Mediterranea sp.]|nr:TonB-dependent receptor plug domain-containing protein [Mediterranea sp.]
MRKTMKLCRVFVLAIGLCLSGNAQANDNEQTQSAAITQQGNTLSGSVQDQFGPAIGVTVSVKGTSNGAITDIEGKFVLKGVSKGDVIRISFVGYATQEITYTGQARLTVTLVEDSQALDEVVVTALGIKRDAKALGYAVSTVNAQELTKVGTPNFGSALYGKAAGVRIQAAPGGSTSAVSMTVRGLSSITGNNQPLLVVDGSPVRNGNANNGEDEAKTSRGWDGEHIQGNGLIDINTEDIESISILKGAAATALYGSEAANGVILVTSKRGVKGSGTKVDFNATLSA